MGWKKSPDELIDQFYCAMEDFEEIELRKMFGYPCSFVNGNMFTGLHEGNWVLRLSEGDRREIEGLGAKPFVPLGRQMREYMTIPPSVLIDSNQLNEWIKKSLAFASALPPKPPKESLKR